MHNQREDTYRNFERPVARWRMKNSWVAHMRYPPTVTPLLMAKQTHTLFWEQRKTLQDLLFAEKVLCCSVFFFLSSGDDGFSSYRCASSALSWGIR